MVCNSTEFSKAMVSFKILYVILLQTLLIHLFSENFLDFAKLFLPRYTVRDLYDLMSSEAYVV